MLSNHEVLLHLKHEAAEKYKPDVHGHKRWKPKDLDEVLKDVRFSLSYSPLESLPLLIPVSTSAVRSVDYYR
jgi:hypothetical protein